MLEECRLGVGSLQRVRKWLGGTSPRLGMHLTVALARWVAVVLRSRLMIGICPTTGVICAVAHAAAVLQMGMGTTLPIGYAAQPIMMGAAFAIAWSPATAATATATATGLPALRVSYLAVIVALA